MKNLLYLISFLSISFIINACKTEGCTDPHAKNFSYEAEKDDGSCDYGGCTDPNALNYDKYAKEDDGSCQYLGGVHFVTTRNSVKPSNVFLALKVNGEFIGNLGQTCSVSFPVCESACSNLKFTEKPSGSYNLKFWEIRQLNSNTFDTIFTSLPQSFKVIGNACNVEVIE